MRIIRIAEWLFLASVNFPANFSHGIGIMERKRLFDIRVNVRVVHSMFLISRILTPSIERIAIRVTSNAETNIRRA